MAFYINYQVPGCALETVDEFPTRKEAQEMLQEYVLSFGPCRRLYVSSRCCKAWRENG